jgi:hypothetical protein
METNSRDIFAAAKDYLATYGTRAEQAVAGDINKALAGMQWNEAHRLFRVQWRIRRLERLDEASTGSASYGQPSLG